MAAALFLRSFSETRDTDPGFRREGVLLAAYDLSGRNLERRGGARLRRAGCSSALRALPGVESAAIATPVPLDIHGLPLRRFTLEGRARSDAAPDRGADQHRHARTTSRRWGFRCAPDADFADLARHARRRRRRSSTRSSCAASCDGAEPLGRRAREPRRHVRDRRRRAQLAVRLVRRAADAGHLLLLPRSSVAARARFTCARAPGDETLLAAGGASASCASSIRRCRSTTSAR